MNFPTLGFPGYPPIGHLLGLDSPETFLSGLGSLLMDTLSPHLRLSTSHNQKFSFYYCTKMLEVQWPQFCIYLFCAMFIVQCLMKGE